MFLILSVRVMIPTCEEETLNLAPGESYCSYPDLESPLRYTSISIYHPSVLQLKTLEPWQSWLMDAV